jgi:hypothetical protein
MARGTFQQSTKRGSRRRNYGGDSNGISHGMVIVMAVAMVATTAALAATKTTAATAMAGDTDNNQLRKGAAELPSTLLSLLKLLSFPLPLLFPSSPF